MAFLILVLLILVSTIIYKNFRNKNSLKQAKIAESDSPSDQYIPYQNRVLELGDQQNTVIIWPFANKQKGVGPYELFLDNNALIHSEWLDHIPPDIASKCVINPWLAFVEQYISNPSFKTDTSSKIEASIQRFRGRGFKFPDDFSNVQSELLSSNDCQLNYQFSLSYLYVAILKKLMMSPNRNRADAIDLLIKLTKENVPRFSACVLLGVLIVLSKKHQRLKLNGDDHSLFSYLESFFAFQINKKNEQNSINSNYLRNRAGDISIWYSIPLLMQQNPQGGYEPLVVTSDKTLHRVLFRLLPPWLTGSKAMSFIMDNSELDVSFQNELKTIFDQINFTFSPPSNETEQLKRLQNLLNFAKNCGMTNDEKSELDKIFAEMTMPGVGKSMLF